MDNQNSILQQPPTGINNSQELYNNYKLYMKQYRAENKESIKSSIDKYKNKNKEKIFIYQKTYYNDYYELHKADISNHHREYYQAKKQRLINEGIIAVKPPMTEDEKEIYELKKLKRRELYAMKKQLNKQNKQNI